MATSQPKNDSTTKGNRVHFRRSGRLTASVFSRQQKDATFYSVSVTRGYTVNDKTEYTSALDDIDVPHAMYLLEHCQHWISTERSK